MNLEDVIDHEDGLQQDEWSLSKPTFGEHGQVEVIGWSGRSKGGKGAKYYILKCSVCSLDKELSGDGIFRCLKSDLINGQMSCGCAKNPRWTKEQWTIKVQRKAKELGCDFIGFVGEWKGHTTKITLVCPKHGQWNTSTLNRLINSNQGCPKCKSEKLSELHSKPDSEMIASFFATGAFHQDTKFWRSDRTDNKGRPAYWNVYCPECNSESESFSGNLQKGSRPCLCSNSRQQQAYINFIKDNESPIAIKFGIANVVSTRVKQQDNSSIYTVTNHIVYEFPTKQQCLQAERECKQELPCGILSKEQMEDGWTETTYVCNLDKIRNIYERNGGEYVEQYSHN